MTPQRLRARRSEGESPNSRALPEVGFRSPSIRFIAVVFPAPFGPSMARTSPGRTAISTPRRAWTGPKLLWASISSTAFCMATPAYRAPAGRASRNPRELPMTSVIPLWRGASLPHAPASGLVSRRGQPDEAALDGHGDLVQLSRLRSGHRRRRADHSRPGAREGGRGGDAGDLHRGLRGVLVGVHGRKRLDLRGVTAAHESRGRPLGDRD